MTDDPLRLLACQVDVPPMTTASERAAHLARIAALVSDALDRAPADLVVLPELASIDYSRASFDALEALAEPADGPSFAIWSGLARRHGCHVVYGFARTEGGARYISQGVVAPDGGYLGHYDKLHLCHYGASMEKDYFTRGDHLLTFDVRGITCAPIICYDIRIPELCRTLALDHGAGLILHCGAYFRDESFATWHDFITARALENQLYLLSLNRAGADYGGSAFCYPWMDETRPRAQFDPHAEDLRYFEVSRADMENARRAYTFLADRLPDYGKLPVG
jgi:nitrilase